MPKVACKPGFVLPPHRCPFRERNAARGRDWSDGHSSRMPIARHLERHEALLQVGVSHTATSPSRRVRSYRTFSSLPGDACTMACRYGFPYTMQA